MKNWSNWTILFVGLELICMVGCKSPYQQRSGRFGYEDFRITEDTFEVAFSGSAKVSPTLATKFAFKRAAEVTLANDFTHFAPLAESDDSLVGTVNTASSFSWSQQIDNNPAVWTSGTATGAAIPMRLPVIRMRIRCFKNPVENARQLIDAKAFLDYNSETND